MNDKNNRLLALVDTDEDFTLPATSYGADDQTETVGSVPAADASTEDAAADTMFDRIVTDFVDERRNARPAVSPHNDAPHDDQIVRRCYKANSRVIAPAPTEKCYRAAPRRCPCCGAEIHAEDCVPYIKKDEALDELLNYSVFDDVALERNETLPLNITDVHELTGTQRHIRYWAWTGNRIKDYPQGLFITKRTARKIRKVADNPANGIGFSIEYDGNGCPTAVITTGGQGGSFKSRAIACPECCQFIPKELWQMDCFGISMVGSKEVGKTVYLISLYTSFLQLFDDQNTNNTGNRGGALKCRRIMTGQAAGITDKFGKVCGEFGTTHQLPESTTLYLPPVFFEMEWRLPDGREYKHLVYIVDQAGEIVAREDAAMLDPVQNSYGVLYFVAPEQFEDLQSMRKVNDHDGDECGGFRVPDNDDETKRVEPDKTVGVRDVATGKDALETAKQIPYDAQALAIVLTKVDRMKGSADFHTKMKEQGVESDLLFTRPSADPSNGIICDFRAAYCMNRVYDALFRLADPFGSLNTGIEFRGKRQRFAVAALGAENEDNRMAVADYAPLHIEEPFLWLVFDFLKKKGKID